MAEVNNSINSINVEPTQNEVLLHQESETISQVTSGNIISNTSTAHPISPAIGRRIDNLLRSAREDRDPDANLRPSNSSMCLRSHRTSSRNAFTQ